MVEKIPLTASGVIIIIEAPALFVKGFGRRKTVL
jgi:hypothetical protein